MNNNICIRNYINFKKRHNNDRNGTITYAPYKKRYVSMIREIEERNYVKKTLFK